jgi:hypothetical protein
MYALARESANVPRRLAGPRCIPVWIFEIGRLGRASLETLEKVLLHAPHLYRSWPAYHRLIVPYCVRRIGALITLLTPLELQQRWGYPLESLLCSCSILPAQGSYCTRILLWHLEGVLPLL